MKTKTNFTWLCIISGIVLLVGLEIGHSVGKQSTTKKAIKTLEISQAILDTANIQHNKAKLEVEKAKKIQKRCGELLASIEKGMNQSKDIPTETFTFPDEGADSGGILVLDSTSKGNLVWVGDIQTSGTISNIEYGNDEALKSLPDTCILGYVFTTNETKYEPTVQADNSKLTFTAVGTGTSISLYNPKYMMELVAAYNWIGSDDFTRSGVEFTEQNAWKYIQERDKRGFEQYKQYFKAKSYRRWKDRLKDYIRCEPINPR